MSLVGRSLLGRWRTPCGRRGGKWSPHSVAAIHPLKGWFSTYWGMENSKISSEARHKEKPTSVLIILDRWGREGPMGSRLQNYYQKIGEEKKIINNSPIKLSNLFMVNLDLQSKIQVPIWTFTPPPHSFSQGVRFEVNFCGVFFPLENKKFLLYTFSSQDAYILRYFNISRQKSTPYIITVFHLTAKTVSLNFISWVVQEYDNISFCLYSFWQRSGCSWNKIKFLYT